MPGRFGQDLIGGHVEEFWLGIDKTADQPGTGNAIDFSPFACNPFHRMLLFLPCSLPAVLPRKRWSPALSTKSNEKCNIRYYYASSITLVIYITFT